MKYLKLIIATVSLISLLSMGAASADSARLLETPKVDLVATSFVGDACNGLTQVSSTGCNGGGTSIGSIVKTVVSIMSIVIGALSVIMIIVAGIRFVTSAGDANSVAGARKTLVYALVGLAVAVLAQLLIHFALGTANDIQNNSNGKAGYHMGINTTGHDS